MDEPDVRLAGAAFEAGDDPNRGFMNVRRQMFRRIEQPQKSVSAHARSRFTRPVPWCDLLVPRTLVQGPDRLLDLRVADNQEPPALHVPAARGTYSCLQDLSDQFVGHRVWFQPSHRPGGANNLKQVGAVVFVRRGVLAGAMGSPRLSEGIA
jgi:hypothetical protein